MDRLLDNAKSELFSEQRRFRHTLDSIEEVKDKLTLRLISGLLCISCLLTFLLYPPPHTHLFALSEIGGSDPGAGAEAGAEQEAQGEMFSAGGHA